MLILAGAELSAQEQVALSGEKLFAGGQFVQMVQTDSGYNDSSLAIQPFNYKNTREWKRYQLMTWLGAGAVLVGTISTFYSLIFLGFSTSGGNDPDTLSIAMISVSGTVLLSSIPLFIVGHKYKKKALQMSAGVTALSVPSPRGFASAPGLSLAFTF